MLTLHIKCKSCGHENWLSRDYLAKYGVVASTNAASIQKRLICSQCSKKNAEILAEESAPVSQSAQQPNSPGKKKEPLNNPSVLIPPVFQDRSQVCDTDVSTPEKKVEKGDKTITDQEDAKQNPSWKPDIHKGHSSEDNDWVLQIPKYIRGLKEVQGFIRDSGKREHVEILEDYLSQNRSLNERTSHQQIEDAIEDFLECKKSFECEYLSEHIDTSIRRARELMGSSTSILVEQHQLRIKRIERMARPCKNPKHKKGIKMTLRESDEYGFFWGCSTYPNCHYKTEITKEQNAILNGEK